MSIYDAIAANVHHQLLIDVQPLAIPAVRRRLLVSEAVNQLLTGPWESREWEDRCYELRSEFDSFIDARFIITASEQRYTKPPCFLKLLRPLPRGIWELRSADPPPQLRILGSFAQRDTFVGLTWALRADLGDDQSIEGKEAWKRAIRQCATDWANLFPAYQPLKGLPIHDHISNHVLV